MPEPSTLAVLTGFYHQFKPSRSPYVWSGLLCIFSMVALAGLDEARAIFLAGFIPVGLIFVLLCVLCLVSEPFSASKNGESLDQDILEEIDEQFKFSRSVGVSVGVFALTYLLYKVAGANLIELPVLLFRPIYPQPIGMGPFVLLGYIACIVHLSIFVIYTMFRSVKEEAIVRTSLFQIAFFTAGTLLALIVSCTNIHDQHDMIGTCIDQLAYKEDGAAKSRKVYGCNYDDVLASESNRIKLTSPDATDFIITRPGEDFDPNKLLFWYFCVLWLSFELFWIWKLSDFKVALVIRDRRDVSSQK